MKELFRRSVLALLFTLFAALCSGGRGAATQGESSPPAESQQDDVLPGHSRHGEGFDEGPRQRPWKLENIGSSHFPITTSVPEVQEWFDQGNTLLHSFWYFEAERAFRWCLKLDPDCAMAWWGLGRAVRGARSEEFFKEAYARKDLVSERERMYLEAWEAAYAPELSGAVEVLDEKGRKQNDILAEELERIAMEHPDDLEAKALVGRYRMRDEGRYGNELIYREILSHRCIPGRTTIASTTGTAPRGATPWTAARCTASWPPTPATPTTCPAISTVASECGTMRPTGWTVRHVSRSTTCASA